MRDTIIFLQIALFSKKPQDLPANMSTFVLSLSLAITIYILATAADFGLFQAMLRAIADLTLLAFFLYAGLYILNLTPRFLQSYSAMVGAGAVINLAALPLLLGFDSDQTPTIVALVSLLLFYAWNLGLSAHIFRNAFGVTLPAGIIVAMAYMFVSISVSQWMFPVLS